ncbi:hypothetical protein AN639_10220 [Candidatus Epulonipiscium fishelsonii]|uniref:Uncharacterized protein n=1 Tax=Candidatus Epulonipiscium fishelsonii TaxID=77094 RepID=A0ACC8X946_9FIRM|nr:hypothetical protein AN396_01550 [Epulopiscium sp. SCG-B11WGA-EpuloA1]ONI43614.1 hypothetical protein AN639_10220 [Epulopiscium sp. SCG-B05WGA-EpuloA1]
MNILSSNTTPVNRNNYTASTKQTTPSTPKTTEETFPEEFWPPDTSSITIIRPPQNGNPYYEVIGKNKYGEDFHQTIDPKNIDPSNMNMMELFVLQDMGYSNKATDIYDALFSENEEYDLDDRFDIQKLVEDKIEQSLKTLDYESVLKWQKELEKFKKFELDYQNSSYSSKTHFNRLTAYQF